MAGEKWACRAWVCASRARFQRGGLIVSEELPSSGGKAERNTKRGDGGAERRLKASSRVHAWELGGLQVRPPQPGGKHASCTCAACVPRSAAEGQLGKGATAAWPARWEAQCVEGALGSQEQKNGSQTLAGVPPLWSLPGPRMLGGSPVGRQPCSLPARGRDQAFEDLPCQACLTGW